MKFRLNEIVPGNNPCLLRHSGVDRIKVAIQTSGRDRSSIFIVQLVSEDPRFCDADEVRKDEVFVKYVVEEEKIALVNKYHPEKAMLDLKVVQFEVFPLPKTFCAKFVLGSPSGIIF